MFRSCVPGATFAGTPASLCPGLACSAPLGQRTALRALVPDEPKMRLAPSGNGQTPENQRSRRCLSQFSHSLGPQRRTGGREAAGHRAEELMAERWPRLRNRDRHRLIIFLPPIFLPVRSSRILGPAPIVNGFEDVFPVQWFRSTRSFLLATAVDSRSVTASLHPACGGVRNRDLPRFLRYGTIVADLPGDGRLRSCTPTS
jgi:hypothetical protein